MLTDDDLTRELTTEFHAATQDLRYTGRVPDLGARRRTARRLTLALPVAAAAAIGAAVVVPQLNDAPAHQAPSASAPHSPAVRPGVLHTVHLVGYTFTYRAARGADVPVFPLVTENVTLPSDAESVPIDGPAKAWIGSVPGADGPGLYIKSPSRWNGKLVVMAANGWGKEQLRQFVLTGKPSY